MHVALLCADLRVCAQYVDYAKGEPTGFLRFDAPEDAQKLRAAAVIEPEGGLTIAKHLITFEALEGTILCFHHIIFSVSITLVSCALSFHPLPACLLLLGLTASVFPIHYRRGRKRILEEAQRRTRSEARLWWWRQGRISEQPWWGQRRKVIFLS